MTGGIGDRAPWRALTWLMPLLVIGGLLGLSQPASGIEGGAVARLAGLTAPHVSQAGDGASSPIEGESLMVAGEFVASPTAGLPEPMCTRPPGQRQCAVSSVAGNAQGDVFAAFATTPFTPGDLGLYRLMEGEEQWQRLDVADPAMPMVGPAPLVPAVTVSEDGSVFVLAFWSAGGEGMVLRSLDNGATWKSYVRAAAGSTLISADRADTLWVGSVDGLLRFLHPASLTERPEGRTAMLDLVRSDCFIAGPRAGQSIEFADGSFECRFPDGALIACSPELNCAISGPSGVTGSYPVAD